jgi:hypothetical protein
MADDTILEIRIHLAASKNRNYRQSVYAIFTSLVKFLQTHRLATKVLLPEGAQIPDDFTLMKSDLTPEGDAVLERSLDRWLEVVSSGKIPFADTSILEKKLAKVRARPASR